MTAMTRSGLKWAKLVVWQTQSIFPRRLVSRQASFDVLTDRGGRKGLTRTATMSVHQNRPRMLRFMSGLVPVASDENERLLTRRWGNELKSCHCDTVSVIPQYLSVADGVTSPTHPRYMHRSQLLIRHMRTPAYLAAGHHIWWSVPYPPPGDAVGGSQLCLNLTNTQTHRPRYVWHLSQYAASMLCMRWGLKYWTNLKRNKTGLLRRNDPVWYVRGLASSWRQSGRRTESMIEKYLWNR